MSSKMNKDFLQIFPGTELLEWYPHLLLDTPSDNQLSKENLPEAISNSDQIEKMVLKAGLPEEWISETSLAFDMIQNDRALENTYRFCCDLLINQKDNYDARLFKDWPTEVGKMGPLSPLFYLLVTLSVIPRIEESHKRLNIPKDTTVATCASIAPKCMDYQFFNKEKGILTWTIHWFQLHMTGELFRIGRFEYMIKKIRKGALIFTKGELCRVWGIDPISQKLKEFNPDGSVIEESEALDDTWTLIAKGGDPMLDIHIPSGGKMSPDAIKESLKDAIGFYDKHFPDHGAKIFECYSWIFSPDIPDFMDKTSNLYSFKEQCFSYPVESEEIGGLIFIFNTDSLNQNEWPENTSLQRRIKTHIQHSGKLRWGGIFMLFNKVNHYGKINYK